jgi:hypothetical protein
MTAGASLRHLPVCEQVAEFERMVGRNPLTGQVLARAATLALPGWYLTAGCLFQTVWNMLAGREPTTGIRDYDLFYHDASDLSWDAEDVVIRRCATVFAGLGVDVEVRNQARVHLWYEGRFGVPCPPHPSTEAAIDSFAATTCCLGIHQTGAGELRTYAPHGFGDLFGFVLRPNPVLAPRWVYEAKARRWVGQWPQLSVLPWPVVADRRAGPPGRGAGT